MEYSTIVLFGLYILVSAQSHSILINGSTNINQTIACKPNHTECFERIEEFSNKTKVNGRQQFNKNEEKYKEFCDDFTDCSPLARCHQISSYYTFQFTHFVCETRQFLSTSFADCVKMLEEKGSRSLKYFYKILSIKPIQSFIQNRGYCNSVEESKNEMSAEIEENCAAGALDKIKPYFEFMVHNSC